MEVELKAREVEVTRLDVLASHPGEGILDVDIDVECSSGTYVRAIARDLGKSLGVGGEETEGSGLDHLVPGLGDLVQEGLPIDLFVVLGEPDSP